MKRTILCVMAAVLSTATWSQQSKRSSIPSLTPTSESQRLAVAEQRQAAEAHSWTSGLDLRCVGPTVMSGRVADLAIADATGQTFYVAYASGGLWRTRNHGTSFEPLFDEALSITLGAVAVHPTSGRIWVGTGEVNSSRSSYAGTGVYYSDDEGKTWQHAGLTGTQHIGRMVLHPDNEEVAFVAALGPLYSNNALGGVYRTTDAGRTWDRVLFTEGQHGQAGAVDLLMDPEDPDHLFAALWDRTRRAWDFRGNGTGSGIWESTDGGDHWTELSARSGFPRSEFTGRIGLTWNASAQQLYALIDNQTPLEPEPEADSLEVYEASDFLELTASEFARLDTTALQAFLDKNNFPNDATAASVFADIADGTLQPVDLHNYLTDGNKALFEAEIVGAEVYRLDLGTADAAWSRTHEGPLDDVCYTYGYYFGLIEVDPTDANHLYIAGVPLIESTDGGAHWKSIGAPNVHVDHHRLWVNPHDPLHLINGNDGGVNISWDGGEHWIKCNSPEVGQFYAVEVDNADPYNIYGGLQDNGTWRGPSKYRKSSGWHQSGHYAWVSIGGGDGMQIEVDPRDAEVVISGSQFGWYSRQTLNDDDYVDIHPQHALGETPLRWNWQTPIWLSRHQSDILYMASNRLHRSFDQGETWETLSGDLTRGGIPGNVPFGTVTSLHESPRRFGQLAVGTDDGLIQISRDGGYSWVELTSPVPQQPKAERTLWVSEVLWSAHRTQRLYVALNGYRLDHFESYVFMTENDGRTWERLGSRNTPHGLPAEPVNALVESADWEDLLFVGTDGGCYSSLDAGQTWGALHRDLPHVPVHDLVIQERENELVIGTHGRSIWVADLGPWLEHKDEAPAEWKTDTLIALDWKDSWGEKGWAWGEPRTVEVEVDVFSEVPLQGQWTWNDSSGIAVATLDSTEISRGWQRLRIPAQWEESNDADETAIKFVDVGHYTLDWRGLDGTTLKGPQVNVRKPED